MIHTARTGTKVKVAVNPSWDNDHQATLYAEEIAKLGGDIHKVSVSRGHVVGIRINDDMVVIPKNALDYAA